MNGLTAGAFIEHIVAGRRGKGVVEHGYRRLGFGHRFDAYKLSPAVLIPIMRGVQPLAYRTDCIAIVAI